jgi:ribosomal silencing factor RsfS
LSRESNQAPENARGLDIHGAEPVAHRFTIADADGNADVELNFSFPLTRKRHAQLEHLLEEGYSEHEAYVLIAGGEILAHLRAIRDRKTEA